MNKPPKEIYLQWVEQEEDSMWEGVTWCIDKIHDSDIKYIRSDLVSSSNKANTPDRTTISRCGNCGWELNSFPHTCPTVDKPPGR